MSAVDDLLSSAATGNQAATLDGDVERDRYGRYLILTADGYKSVPHTRATTVAKTLSDTYALEQWGKRMAAIGLTKRPDLFARVAAADPGDTKTLNGILDDAQEAAAASVGRNLGTALHSFTERLDRGDDVTATPAPWNADLTAYREELVRAGVRIVPEMIERVVVLEELAVAGTFDRLCTVPGIDLPVVSDLKTAKDIFDWLPIAIQLALYAHADFIYDPKTKTRHPMPAVDRDWGLVMHLPAGKATCTLHLVNVAAGWEAVQLAMEARRWRNRKDMAYPLGALLDAAEAFADLGSMLTDAATVAPPDVEGLQRPVVDQVVIDAANQQLRRRLGDVVQAGVPTGQVIWPAGVPTFKQGGPTTWAEVKAVEALIDRLDGLMSMPFSDPLPEDPTAPPAPDRPLGGVEDPTGPVAPVYPIDRPAPEVLQALRDRNAALPEDLRAHATALAREAGVPARHLEWTGFHVKTIEEAIAAAEALHVARMTDVKVALAELEADQVLAVLTCAGHVQGAEVDDLEAARIVAIAGAIDSGALGLLVHDDGLHVVQCNDGPAEAALLWAHNTKTAVLAAAKNAAALHGRPKPRSTAEVAADPVLVAVLTAEGSTSNQTSESENPK